MKTKVAIQGNRASFHDIAAEKFFGSNTDRIFCDSFKQAFQSLADDTADYALSAIENSLYGSINEVYDLLVEFRFQIIGEVYLRIEQCLIGQPNTDISHIRKVYSHPVALAQCAQYLDETLKRAEREEYHDTAAAVGLVKKLADSSIAAIGSKQAALLYDLSILAGSIETNKENYTRFVILSKTPNSNSDQNKTSLILEVNHSPGALYAALGVFANHRINLTKLQSRPIFGKAWHYLFYVDIEIGANNPEFKEVLRELNSRDCIVTLLGSYVATN